VETPNAALDAKVLCVVLAEFLGCKLLQAIGILRLKFKLTISHQINRKENVILFQMNAPQQARHQIPSSSHLCQAA